MEQNKKNNPFGGMRQERRAVSDFLRAGRRNEARREMQTPMRYDRKQADGPNPPVARMPERPGELVDRIRSMSDDEFGEALRSGALTTDQVRKAGEYDWDTWMGDVWMETDWPDKIAEPTYDEFMADPEKYGYQRGINEETDRAFDRYRRAGSHPLVMKKK